MSFKDKLMSILDYTIVKKIVFRGNRKLCFFYVSCYKISVFLIILYVFYNGGQYKTYNNANGFVNVKVNQAFRTNYTYDQFNNSYIKLENLPLYNRVWTGTDYAEMGALNRVTVFTNLIITPNQTLGTCPEHPVVSGAICDPNKPDECKAGKIMSRGIQTGKCVVSDFPFWNKKEHKVTYGYTCEKYGWCPSGRYFMPLKDERPLLKDTKNSLMYVKVALPFPDFKFTLVNENKSTMIDTLRCRWHPINDPYCQLYLLEDIVKLTPNIRQSYDDFAKYGGTISIDMYWDCTKPLFYKFDWLSNCIIKFNLMRLDNQDENDKLGAKSYSRIFTADNKLRTSWRIYGIEFIVNPRATLRVWSWYNFVLAVGALFSFAYYLPLIYEKYIRYKYKKLNLDEIINLESEENDNDGRIDNGYQESSDLIIETINQDEDQDYQELSDVIIEPINQDQELESTYLINS